mgnify:CR=1 FL=1
MARKVVLAGACRTAIGKMGGALSNTPAADLGAIVIKEALRRAGVKPEMVNEVKMGCVIQAAQGQNVARPASIKEGLPIEVPEITINVVCGSGLKCVNDAATMIMAGEADIVVAGGMENMSMAPYAMTKARFGYRMNNATIIDTMVNDALTDAFNHYHMMITAENVCDKYGITREELDEFSANSQQKCEKAIAEGKFADEIVPVPVKVKKEIVDFVKDEGPRAGTTAESLAKLKCCSGKEGGLVTAGNASGINDGAAAIVVMSEEKAKELIYNVGDGTHIGEYGATLYARLAVQGLAAQGLLTEYFNANPDVLINPVSHNFGKSYLNAGSVYAFSVSGIDLTPENGKITVTASEGFEVSRSATEAFASTLEISYENGNVPMTSIYVKFLPTEKGVKNGTLTVSNGTNTKTATLTGEGVSFEGGVAAQAYWQLSQDTKAVVTGPILAAEEVFSQMYADRYAKPGNPTTWIDGWIDPETKTQRNIIEGDEWPENEIDVNYNRYIEFSVTANAGTTFNIDSIGLYAGGSGGNGMCFRVMCSKDPGFGEYTLISNRPTNVSNTMYPISLKEIIELNGEETLYLRVYPWYSSKSNRKSICLYGVTVKGVVTEGGVTSIETPRNVGKAYCAPAITTDKTTLHYGLSELSPVNITLYDMEGRTMHHYNDNLEAGDYAHEISLGGFLNGIYLCKLMTGNRIQTLRIIKK